MPQSGEVGVRFLQQITGNSGERKQIIFVTYTLVSEATECPGKQIIDFKKTNVQWQ